MSRFAAHIIVLLLFSLSFGCAETSRTPPADVLSKPELVAVLTQVQLFDAAKGTRAFGRKPSNQLLSEYVTQIEDSTGVSMETFTASYKWWGQYPDEISLIWEKVIEELTLMESEMDNNKMAK